MLIKLHGSPSIKDMGSVICQVSHFFLIYSTLVAIICLVVCICIPSLHSYYILLQYPRIHLPCGCHYILDISDFLKNFLHYVRILDIYSIGGAYSSHIPYSGYTVYTARFYDQKWPSKFLMCTL